MNELVEKFGDKLVLLAFSCNQFGHQENGHPNEIRNEITYVRPGNGFIPKFILMEKCEVNGKNAHPIFKFLRERLPLPADDAISFMANGLKIIWEPVTRADLAWNFEKFLISPDGKPAKRFSRYLSSIKLKSEIQRMIDENKIK